MTPSAPPARALLICPADRPGIAFLGRQHPLALAPILGRSLVDLWLAELAHHGAKEVLILAADRPEEVRHCVGLGERWGLKAQTVPETRELTPDEARTKYDVRPANGWLASPWDVSVLDHLPGGEAWRDVRSWFEALVNRLPVETGRAVGFREFPPEVWTHARARIASNARVEPPCWIGAQAWIGDHARIGPRAVVEDGAFVDDGAEVANSFVGPSTYVGAMTDLRKSLAWGRGLFNWSTNSFTEVTDEFLLGDLCRRRVGGRRPSWIGRVAAGIALGLTWPVLLFAWIRRRRGTAQFIPRQAVRAPVGNCDLLETCVYHELNGVRGLWRRWPELWKIVQGQFAWVGNRPLTREEASALQTDFERLALSVPCGLFSLADAEGCDDLLSDEGRAHASFYAVCRGWRANARILRRVFARARRVSFP